MTVRVTHPWLSFRTMSLLDQCHLDAKPKCLEFFTKEDLGSGSVIHSKTSSILVVESTFAFFAINQGTESRQRSRKGSKLKEVKEDAYLTGTVDGISRVPTINKVGWQ